MNNLTNTNLHVIMSRDNETDIENTYNAHLTQESYIPTAVFAKGRIRALVD